MILKKIVEDRISAFDLTRETYPRAVHPKRREIEMLNSTKIVNYTNRKTAISKKVEKFFKLTNDEVWAPLEYEEIITPQALLAIARINVVATEVLIDILRTLESQRTQKLPPSIRKSNKCSHKIGHKELPSPQPMNQLTWGWGYPAHPHSPREYCSLTIPTIFIC